MLIDSEGGEFEGHINKNQYVSLSLCYSETIGRLIDIACAHRIH